MHRDEGCVKWRQGFFFFQAEDGIRDLVRSRGLGDVYKRQFHEASWEGEVENPPFGNNVFPGKHDGTIY